MFSSRYHKQGLLNFLILIAIIYSLVYVSVPNQEPLEIKASKIHDLKSRAILPPAEREEQRVVILNEEDKKLESGTESYASYSTRSSQIPILVLSCNRPGISRTLDTIFKYKPDDGFPVIVSQDCECSNTSRVIESYRDKLIYLKQPDQSYIPMQAHYEAYIQPYYRLSRHYKWAITQVLEILMFEQVIVLEDDLEVAPGICFYRLILDFFRYFSAFLPVLLSDPTVFCISAWNDNGREHLVSDSEAFYRTDFFPGLGWMLSRTFWREISKKWPQTFWDDWIRNPAVRKGRACIRPEISRTKNFGREGVSGGQMFDEFVGKVVLNESPVEFSGSRDGQFLSNKMLPFPSDIGIDVRYFIKENYDKVFLYQVYSLSTVIRVEELDDIHKITSGKVYNAKDEEVSENIAYMVAHNSNKVASSKYKNCGKRCTLRFRIEYKQWTYGKAGLGDLISLMEHYKLMSDIREDVARMSYMGIVPFRKKILVDKNNYENALVYLAPFK
jgi:alpha-1,3-mannosyl-glycoprotein beta-1,2-N-acetylglucosaminyltransferase